MRLVDKVAIITGAASGIGRASAVVFAQEGAKVVAADINDDGGKETVNSIKANSGEAVFVHTDVVIPSEAENLTKVTKREYGKIDILLNAAAIIHTHMPIEDIDETLWDRVYDVNVKGVLHTMKYAIPYMKEARSGAIINIAAGAGLTPPQPNCSAYASSKGAILTLTKVAALELVPYNVRANCINPSGTDTPMLHGVFDDLGLDEAAREASAQEMSFGRLIKPEEIAYAALFLASDEALMVTGAFLNVNAGKI